MGRKLSYAPTQYEYEDGAKELTILLKFTSENDFSGITFTCIYLAGGKIFS